jgi:non-lysosomal glucosylceramidase
MEPPDARSIMTGFSAKGGTRNAGRHFIYRGARGKEISFPLGGIGSGCIGLAGNGRLLDWEIFNRPNKSSANGFSHFAIKAEAGGEVMDARALNGDLMPPYVGEVGKSYGFGPSRDNMAGVPHFREVEFRGEYPMAVLKFHDEKFPGQVQMVAFNPFIPLNDVDSSIPAAFFEIKVINGTRRPIDYTVALSVRNPLPAGSTVNAYGAGGRVRFIKLSSDKLSEDDVNFGDLTIATDAEGVSYQEFWYRGQWFDSLGVYWRELSAPGRLQNRRYEKGARGLQDMCTLAAHFQVRAGESGGARFVISWNFPNCYNYWRPKGKGRGGCACPSEGRETWRNYYATLFGDSTRSATFSLENWERLHGWTARFHDALFSSTLPDYVLDAVSANLSILKTPTALRLEDGSFYGWEGCNPSSGCCEGSCTHVWNYQYALPFLFPQLERSMRDLDFRFNQREDGRMSFRLQLPPGRGFSDFPHACADGQFGGVIKFYRDWKISGDSAWLRSRWEGISKSIEYAWAETNEDKWDVDRDGVLEGRQHHTLDMELFGPNSWLTGFYLAALKAGAEMADHLGEGERAREYRDLFRRGKAWADAHLFNGQYYHQVVDLKDRGVLEKFKALDPKVEATYWDDEHRELKYQYAEGCEVDQVLAQWHANICGLGEIFDGAQRRRALRSIFRYNFKRGLRDFFNPCRIFGLNGESALVICEWPEGAHKPVFPVPYAEEAMNGFEYAAACHMIQEGLIDEGLEVVKAVRDRYDGEKRNPWNEFECGSNYARSMASYALLLALSGFEFDMVKGCVAFNPPRTVNGRFRCFWSLGEGWGTFEMRPGRATITVECGRLRVSALKLPFLKGLKLASISIGKRPLEFKDVNGKISLRSPALIGEGQELVIRASKRSSARKKD